MKPGPKPNAIKREHLHTTILPQTRVILDRLGKPGQVIDQLAALASKDTKKPKL